MFISRCLRGHFGLVGLVGTSLLVLMVEVTDVQAKRGCFAYGHSCLGGLGKRAEAASNVAGDPGDMVEVMEAAGRRAIDDGEAGDVMIRRFDGLGGMAWPSLGYDNVAVLTGGERQMQRMQKQLTPQQLYQLSPILRQLLRSVRTNQDLNVSDV